MNVIEKFTLSSIIKKIKIKIKTNKHSQLIDKSFERQIAIIDKANNKTFKERIRIHLFFLFFVTK